METRAVANDTRKSWTPLYARPRSCVSTLVLYVREHKYAQRIVRIIPRVASPNAKTIPRYHSSALPALLHRRIRSCARLHCAQPCATAHRAYIVYMCITLPCYNSSFHATLNPRNDTHPLRFLFFSTLSTLPHTLRFVRPISKFVSTSFSILHLLYTFYFSFAFDPGFVFILFSFFLVHFISFIADTTLHCRTR